jgi:hypothetical protein
MYEEMTRRKNDFDDNIYDEPIMTLIHNKTVVTSIQSYDSEPADPSIHQSI